MPPAARPCGRTPDRVEAQQLRIGRDEHQVFVARREFDRADDGVAGFQPNELEGVLVRRVSPARRASPHRTPCPTRPQSHPKLWREQGLSRPFQGRGTRLPALHRPRSELPRWVAVRAARAQTAESCVRATSQPDLTARGRRHPRGDHVVPRTRRGRSGGGAVDRLAHGRAGRSPTKARCTDRRSLQAEPQLRDAGGFEQHRATRRPGFFATSPSSSRTTVRNISSESRIAVSSAISRVS